jgi:hypothetical protein
METKMKNIIVLSVILALALIGCAGSDIQIDGEVSEVEAQYIRLGVGAALTAMPEAVMPAYEASYALLSVDMDNISTLAGVDSLLEKEFAKLNMPPEEIQILRELAGLIKAKIKSKIGATEITSAQRIVLVRTLIEIVYDASKARIQMD